MGDVLQGSEETSILKVNIWRSKPQSPLLPWKYNTLSIIVFETFKIEQCAVWEMLIKDFINVKKMKDDKWGLRNGHLISKGFLISHEALRMFELS